MKKLLFILLFAIPFLTNAQGVDSTRIPQTITMSQKYHEYILGFNSNWGDVDMINYINQLRAQMDSTNKEKPITVTVPSGLIRDIFQSMSYQPEGQATQYNENILLALGNQITNPWLGAAIQLIRQANWDARDSKIADTEKRLLSINKLN
jgi:hypothetical protein